MIDQGVWILAVMIYGARHELTLQPYEYYPSYQLCKAWMARESNELGLPMTCVKQDENDI